MWGYELGPLSLFRISAAPNTMMRTSRAIAACDPECLHLSVVLRGQLNAAQEGRTGVARTGDVISYETSHPVIFRADQPYESLVVRVPQQLLGREEAQISRLTAVGISGRTGLPRAAVAFFRSCSAGWRTGRSRRRTRRTPSSACSTSSAACTRRRRARREPMRLRSRAEILLNIQSFIEANLGDPNLDPERDRPRELHLDAVSAQALRGGGDERLPVDPRDAAGALPPRPARPGARHETILAIASRWGLPGPQHFSRLFRSAYGCSPSELRREATPRRLGVGSAAARAAERRPVTRRS